MGCGAFPSFFGVIILQGCTHGAFPPRALRPIRSLRPFNGRQAGSLSAAARPRRRRNSQAAATVRSPIRRCVA